MKVGEATTNGAPAKRQGPAITLDELALDSQRIGELTHREIGVLLVQVSALSLALSSGLAIATPAAGGNGASNDASGAPDRLLNVHEAAARLGMSATTLYRNKDRYPFLVRNGRAVRFSSNGIEKWIGRRSRLMRLRLQTSANSAIAVAISAIALRAGVLVLTMLAPGAARAAATAEIHPEMIMNAGWYAIAEPPRGMVEGRRVVLVSAAGDQWSITSGPYLSLAECGSALSQYARPSLPDEVYERFKAGRGYHGDEDDILADVARRNAHCVISDGSERFRTSGTFKTDPSVEYEK